MPNNPLFHSVHGQSASIHDQIQIALAIADPPILKSLLVNCVPPITQSHLIGSLTTEIGVVTPDHQAIDGLIHFEAIRCILADPHQEAELNAKRHADRTEGKYPRWESGTHSLEPHLNLAQAMSLLENLGFSPQQVERILYLPAEAGHKTWWFALDSTAEFTIPFLRLIRTLRYPDGTFTFQYKDFFEQEQPCCFKSQSQQVLVEIKSEGEGFSETLKRINWHRSVLGISQVVLICNTISELEAHGFISQGISVYPAGDLVLPTQANCILCARHECPMNGLEESPVVMCYGFLIDASYV